MPRGICKKCGCQWFTPCVKSNGETCAWQDKANTLCTFCAEKKAKRASKGKVKC